jgi:trehalose utilization protein
MNPIRVLIWNEGRHERSNPRVAELYPQGIHGALAIALSNNPDLHIATATLDQDPEQGLDERRLENTDVLVWWGHMAHDAVRDNVVERVHRRIMAGMGLVALHSAHFSKIFRRLMGTSCDLKWREGNDREIVWVTSPGHPIAAGIEDHFILEREEMYGEHFDIPEPMETVFISNFSGGEVFRSGVTFTRGAGRIFYFRPGHETYPAYHNPNVLKVIENAVCWAAASGPSAGKYGHRLDGWIMPKS